MLAIIFINSLSLIAMEEDHEIQSHHTAVTYGQENYLFSLSTPNDLRPCENIFEKQSDLPEWIARNENLARAIKNTWTILHAAADAGLTELIKHLVLDQGIDINSESFSGYTPLYFAILNNHAEAVELLIELGAGVNIAKGRLCNTPLHAAAMEGNPEIINILTKKGAHPNCLNVNGKLPIDIAQDNSCLEAFIMLYENTTTEEDIHFSNSMSKKWYYYIAYKALLENDLNVISEIIKQDLFTNEKELINLIELAINYKVHKDITYLLTNSFLEQPKKSYLLEYSISFIRIFGLCELAIKKNIMSLSIS